MSRLPTARRRTCDDDMKKAFTLIEVNLAMLVMAGGILSIVGLYAFGFRENRQSREDVSAAAYADAVVSPLVMAISATNQKWSVFRRELFLPGPEGWGEYLNNGVVKNDPQGKAQAVYARIMSDFGSVLPSKPSFPTMSSDPRMSAALVVMHPR